MSAEISPSLSGNSVTDALSPDVIRVAQALVAAVSPPKPEPAPMSRPGDELPPLLTIGQTATLMQVSEMTVRRAIWANELPSVRFRGTYRIPLAFVQRVLTAANAGTAVVVEEFAAAWQAEVAGSGVA